MKPLTGDEMEKALQEARAASAKAGGRPMQIIHNRCWDYIWKGPWRIVERAAKGNEVIVRDVGPAAAGATPDSAHAMPPHTPYVADVPAITARRADLPGCQEPRI